MNWWAIVISLIPLSIRALIKTLGWVKVILFEIDCAIFYTNLHELFCQFINWTNWVNSGKFMDNCWISCQVMADMKKVYDYLIILTCKADSEFCYIRCFTWICHYRKHAKLGRNASWMMFLLLPFCLLTRRHLRIKHSHSAKGSLISESFSLRFKSLLITYWKRSGCSREVIWIFLDLSHIEKLSQIKPPLPLALSNWSIFPIRISIYLCIIL